MRRWTDDSYAGRTKFQAPALVVTYNMFMNGVDVMDQYRAPVGLFFFLMDLCIHNSFAVDTKLCESNPDLPDHKFSEYKRRVCVTLVTPRMDQ